MYLYLSFVTIGLLSGTFAELAIMAAVGWSLAVSLLALWRCPGLASLLSALCGCCAGWRGPSWSVLMAGRIGWHNALPAAQDRTPGHAAAGNSSVPEQRGQVWRLQARVLTPAARLQQQGLPPLQQLQLNWYRTPHTPAGRPALASGRTAAQPA